MTVEPKRLTLAGHEEPVLLRFQRYHHSDNAAIVLECTDGEPYAVASVNPDEFLAADEVAVKIWSENEGMAEFLLENGIIEGEPVRFIPSGFVMIPVFKLSQDSILSLPTPKR